MKTGRLTREEQKYIVDNYELKSPTEIADALDRRVQSILDFIENLPNKKAHSVVDGVKTRPFWKELEKQFDAGEMEHFADEFAGFIKQFEGEILHSEEIQIVDAVRIGILANRCLREERALLNTIEYSEMELKKEKMKVAPDLSYMEELNHNILVNRQLQDKASSRYNDFIKAKLNSLDKLKATRDKREDARNSAYKTSFKDWIKRLVDDRSTREELGMVMERGRIAADTEYKRLTQLHQYIDKKIDIPILNSESAKALED